MKRYALQQMINLVLKVSKEKGWGWSAKDVTNSSAWRMSTPTNHEAGAWVAAQVERFNYRRHPRGLHYLLISSPQRTMTPKDTWYGDPNFRNEKGNPFNWYSWLLDGIQAAKWLDYVDFDTFTDQRNAEYAPLPYTAYAPWDEVELRDADGEVLTVRVPTADELTPRAALWNFYGNQPFRLVIIGEKSSLNPILAPLAERYEIDLFLPTGDISDTRLYEVMAAAALDPRPLKVLYFSDSDPSGYNMPISVAERLLALKHLHFEDVEVEVYRAALTPQQVLDNPDMISIPLKTSETRRFRWRWAFFAGTEHADRGQTEIDALAGLNPELLEEIAETAIRSFYDDTLDDRVDAVREDWRTRAQQAVEAHGGQELVDKIAETAAWFEEMRVDGERRLAEIRVFTQGVELPEIPAIPEPEPNADGLDEPERLMSTVEDDHWLLSLMSLNEQKQYGEDLPDGWDGDEEEAV